MKERAAGNRGKDGVRDGLGFIEDVKDRVHVGRYFRVPSFRASGVVGGESHGKASLRRADLRLVERPSREERIVHVAAKRGKELLFYLHPRRRRNRHLSSRKTGEKVQDGGSDAVARLAGAVRSDQGHAFPSQGQLAERQRLDGLHLPGIGVEAEDMAEEEADGKVGPAVLRVEFAGDGSQRGFLVFLELGQLLGVQGDLAFQWSAGNARYILPDSVAEFLRGKTGCHFQPRFNGELLRGDGGRATFRVERNLSSGI